MGKLGGDELNYSSDVDIILVYGDDGETTGGEAGRAANGDFFAEAVRLAVDALEAVTAEGHAFRVHPRPRPEGRMRALTPPPPRYRAHVAHRPDRWEPQAPTQRRL